MPAINIPNLLRAVHNGLDQFSLWVGKTISWLMLLMMFVTSLIVILRYLFNSGSIALQESVVYLHGIVFMLGIAYAMKQKAHVRVDIIYQKLAPRYQALIDLFGTILFLLPFTIFIIWVSMEYVQFSWSVQESSPEPGGLPGIYLLKTLIPIMGITLLLQGISELLKSLLVIFTARKDSAA